jgi:cobalt-zinc-cadmium efflux system outer membrane protein
LQSYERDILPRAQRVAQQAELAYTQGALTLSDLLDARRTLRTTRLEALAAQADFAKAQGTWQLRIQPATP